MSRVAVLGCGVAGTVVANRLVRARRRVEVTVIDGHGDHVYQAGLIDVAFGVRTSESLRRDARPLLDPLVRLVVDKVEGIDPAARRIDLASGARLEYDVAVIATGSRNDRGGIEGISEGSRTFHCPRQADELARELAAFGGGRIVVGATRLPYRCPPSPVEFALRLDAKLRGAGRPNGSRITYVYPIEQLQPNPAIGGWARALLVERGIEIRAPFQIERIEPGAKRLVSSTGEELPFDLAVLVPPHRGASFLDSSGLAAGNGWVKADPRTLRAGDGLYCLGDAADLPASKSGAAARYQAAAVAANVLAEIEGRTPSPDYAGRAT